MQFNPAKRDSFIYDFIVKQYSTADWKATAGTPAMDGNNFQLNAAAVASYILYQFGEYEFSINVPTTPSTGEAKHWGLRAPATDNLGAIYFEIAGAVFRAVSRDEFGNTETTNITWSTDPAWANNQVRYGIVWENGHANFLVNGVRYATHSKVPSLALPLRIVNADSDDTDVAYIGFKEVATIV